MTDKPTIESLIPYLKKQIPGCSISMSEVDQLKSIYDRCSVKDIRRVFYGAIKHKAIQPFSYMFRQLQIIKPETPFDSTKLNSQRFNYRGRRIDSGTNWDAKRDEFYQNMDEMKSRYDAQFGDGAWDKGNSVACQHLKEQFKFLEQNPDKQLPDLSDHDIMFLLNKTDNLLRKEVM